MGFVCIGAGRGFPAVRTRRLRGDISRPNVRALLIVDRQPCMPRPNGEAILLQAPACDTMTAITMTTHPNSWIGSNLSRSVRAPASAANTDSRLRMRAASVGGVCFCPRFAVCSPSPAR